MTNTSQKIVFFGTEDFSAVSLEGLIRAGFTIALVVTKPDAPKGRGHKLHAPKVKMIAEAQGIPVLQPTKLSEIEPTIAAMQPVTGVLVSYGKIIPQRIIDLFTPGIINLHPSLLPEYRGPSPIESAIFNGDSKTGVSIMSLTAKMDAGPVYRQVEVPLTGTETSLELYESLGELGTRELVQVLPAIIDGTLEPIEQSEPDATYCSLLSKDHSLLDPSAMTADEAERHVRAYLDFPRSRITVNGHTVIVLKAHVEPDQKTPLDVAFRDGNYLSIDELIAPSGKTMSSLAFEAGYIAKTL